MKQDTGNVQRLRAYHPVAVSDCETARPSKEGEDIVCSVMKVTAGVLAHRFRLANGRDNRKGIICDVWEDEWMPVDSSGNRADVITDFDSTTKRMNPLRTYEPYINASGRMVSLNIQKMLYDEEPLETMWNYLTGYYDIIAPLMKPYLSRFDEFRKRRHLESVAKDGVYRLQPTDNPVDYVSALDELRRKYPAPYGPVQYIGYEGRRITTKANVLIGGMYLILLEKIGNTWQAVSSPKVQHYGIPAKLTNTDKYSAPGRHNPVRIFGESEVRVISAVCGGDIAADVLDQSNNPIVHREITKNILTAENPTNIDKVIDRTKYPVGRGRILTLVKHILECAGIRIVRGNGSINQ